MFIMMTSFASNYPSLVQPEEVPLEFVLPGEVFHREIKDSDSSEHMAVPVRHRTLSFDTYCNDESNELEACCITMLEILPERKNQNSTIAQRNPSMCIKDNSIELPTGCVEDFPKNKVPALELTVNEAEVAITAWKLEDEKKNESGPVSRRTNNRAEQNIADIQYVGIFRELALTLESEVRRSLMKVVRNDKKALKILGISSS